MEGNITGNTLNLIQEIVLLWRPVYPHLAKHIVELYGRKDGDILEIGPFGGVIFSLIENGVGKSFSIATFPKGMVEFYIKEARRKGLEKRIKIFETDSSLKEMEGQSTDLAIFRGALFFPSLFRVNFKAIYRILKPKGIAFIGGGFGKFTPDEVIKRIGKRSRELNLEIGKVEISEDKIHEDIKKSNIKANFEIIKEGGLWVLMKKSISA